MPQPQGDWCTIPTRAAALHDVALVQPLAHHRSIASQRTGKRGKPA